MEIQFYGANCVRLTTKKAGIVVDDNLKELGLKPVAKPEDLLLSTDSQESPPETAQLLIDKPGEYEASETSIHGIAARSHMDEEGKRSATIFKLVVDDIRVAITGHIYPELDDEQLEKIGTVDVLIVSVGGGGYTLDATGAMNVVRKIEPKIIIPTHFADKNINYPVPQAKLDEVLKNIPMEPGEAVPKLKLKSSSDIPEIIRLVILERQ